MKDERTAPDSPEPTGPSDDRFIYVLTDEGARALLVEHDGKSAPPG